ncbi:efflux RND transporter periplasmic adaptor subunit [Pseudoalteromonas luteoviolacea]|uniref:efflux RND transporter periplasmic adaptor subunit n=1 Tax=Pseudoalteromonas luteoviolacea TaxID=43657 RepID=UPI001B39C389|nr:efflux RND transporter periplasmic adaptor subunit [Pseudoalteromonas luteoviolacea]MBQ4875744.1 efflux RND transporter periplasmic adaptor subunit [Pseudoalteromonas luteoviolacea]MBQ4904779.1 efflux RND transporter periplasmic adaptor subunit [Pseudoalteromonas luteoviolacea]
MRVLLGLMLLLNAHWAWADNQGAEKKGLPVAAYSLQQATGFHQFRQVTGQVVKHQEAEIGFEFSGVLEALYADQGDTIRKGQILAKQDTQLLEIEKLELLANLDKIKAQLTLAQQDSERLLKLSKSNYSAQQQLDQNRSQIAVLKAEIQVLNVKLKGMDVRLDKAHLKAPFDGVIAMREVSIGEVVGPGQIALRVLEQSNSEVRIGVPQNLLSNIQPMMPITIGGSVYQAQKRSGGTNLDPISRTVQLRFSLPSDAVVFSGQMASMIIAKKREKLGYWVPMSALTNGTRGTWQIYQIEQGHLQPTAVEVLHSDGQYAFIDGDLENGTKILANGTHKVAANIKVDIVQSVATRGEQQ